MAALELIVTVALALCVGVVGGALVARWAITAPHYKERWQSALKLVEALDVENTRLHDGLVEPHDRAQNRKLVDRLLERRPKPLGSLLVAEVGKRPKRPTDRELARMLRGYRKPPW